jgi:hypothetical protein
MAKTRTYSLFKLTDSIPQRRVAATQLVSVYSVFIWKCSRTTDIYEMAMSNGKHMNIHYLEGM